MAIEKIFVDPNKRSKRMRLIRVLDQTTISPKSVLWLDEGHELRIFVTKLKKFEEFSLKIGIFTGQKYLAFGFDKPYIPNEHTPSMAVTIPAETLLSVTAENRERLFLQVISESLNEHKKGNFNATISSLDFSDGNEVVNFMFEIENYIGNAKIPLVVLAPFLCGTSKAMLMVSNLTLETANEYFEDNDSPEHTQTEIRKFFANENPHDKP